MDKLKLAHEYALEMAKQGIPLKSCKELGWKYADAMQAEADERINKERPEVLLTKDKDGKCLHFHHEFGHKKCMDCGASLEEWQPDWSQAPETAIAWKMQSKSNAVWIHNKSLSAFEYSIAPSLNYQGNWQDSLRKRPEALCEVDWRVAPTWAKYWAVREGGDTALWCINKPTVTGDCFLSHGGCSPAPSFGFTGSHIVERPHGF